MSNLERDNGQSRGVIGASRERVMGGCFTSSNRPRDRLFSISRLIPPLLVIFYSLVGILSAAFSRWNPQLHFRQDDTQAERPSHKICTASYDRLGFNLRNVGWVAPLPQRQLHRLSRAMLLACQRIAFPRSELCFQPVKAMLLQTHIYMIDYQMIMDCSSVACLHFLIQQPVYHRQLVSSSQLFIPR